MFRGLWTRGVLRIFLCPVSVVSSLPVVLLGASPPRFVGVSLFSLNLCCRPCVVHAPAVLVVYCHIPSLVFPWRIFSCVLPALDGLAFDIRPWSLGIPVLGVWTRAMEVLGPLLILILCRQGATPPSFGGCLCLKPPAYSLGTFWLHPLKVLHPLPWYPSPGLLEAPTRRSGPPHLPGL